jgi:hypothetical protein
MGVDHMLGQWCELPPGRGADALLWDGAVLVVVVPVVVELEPELEVAALAIAAPPPVSAPVSASAPRILRMLVTSFRFDSVTRRSSPSVGEP